MIKQKNKYSKLQKKFQDIYDENVKLQDLFQKKESEYQNLYTNHEELLKHVELVEQEKKNVFIEYKKINEENTQLHEDVTLLKILIYQLNIEIGRYQDKLRLLNQKPGDSTIENLHDNVDSTLERKKVTESWGRVNFHALGPLLEAYQENIKEKEELMQQFRQECDDFAVNFKEIIAENEQLRKEVDYYKLKVMSEFFTS